MIQSAVCLSLLILASRLYAAPLPTNQSKHPVRVAKKNRSHNTKTLKTAFDLPPVLLGQGAPEAGENHESIHTGIRMLSEIIARIEARGFKKPNFEKFFERALQAAVPYDAHSGFYSKSSYKNMLESTAGEFSGIGVTITSKQADDAALTVLDVIEDGPASEAKLISDEEIITTTGLAAGDEIIEVDKEKLQGLTTDEAIAKLKGPTRSTVVIKVIRNKKLHEFSIVRGEVKHEVSLCYHFKNNNVFYLSLRVFSENAPKLLKDLLLKAMKQNANGIILDLRRNPGGVLDIAVDIVGLFAKKGSLVVSTKNGSGQTVSSYSTTTQPIFASDIPLFILTDNYTASAAEILAGCLHYYARQEADKDSPRLNAFVVGNQTFGKGSVQEVMPISNGCALKLTTMLYYLPSGQTIQALGITPDFVINPLNSQTQDEKLMRSFHGRESDLQNHITRDDVATVDKTAPEPAQAKKATHDSKPLTLSEKRLKKLREDNQVKAALTLINLFRHGQQHSPHLMDTHEKTIAFLKSLYVTDENLQVEKICS